jgi:hypothetical protein
MFKRNLPLDSPWRPYQRVQRLIALINLALVGGAILIAELAPDLFGSKVALVIIACVVAIPNLVAGYWLRNFSCPRCHQPFFWTLPSQMVRLEQGSENPDSGRLSLKSGLLALGTERERVVVNLRQDTLLARRCRNCALPIWHEGWHG